MDAPADALAFDPTDCRGKQAVLLLFAPSVNSPVFQMQMELLQGEDEAFHARDLLLAQVLYEGESYVNGRKIERESVVRLRERYDVKPDAFCLVLIDRDGNERRRDDAPIKLEALLAPLDAASEPS